MSQNGIFSGHFLPLLFLVEFVHPFHFFLHPLAQFGGINKLNLVAILLELLDDTPFAVGFCSVGYSTSCFSLFVNVAVFWVYGIGQLALAKTTFSNTGIDAGAKLNGVPPDAH